MRDVLRQLEELLSQCELAVALVSVAGFAGRDVEVDDEELRASSRRALFVLAAGGDPDRALDLRGPAVTTFAGELDAPERRGALEAGLAETRAASIGLPHVTEAVQALLADADAAWRAFACALLVEQLDEDD